MSTEYVQDAGDIVKLGDTVHVRVSEIQDDGKIKLTMLTPEQEEQSRRGRSGGAAPRGGDRGGGRGGGPSGGTGSWRDGRFCGGRRARSGGGEGVGDLVAGDACVVPW